MPPNFEVFISFHIIAKYCQNSHPYKKGSLPTPPPPPPPPPRQTSYALFRPISVVPPIPEFRLIWLIFPMSQGIRVPSTVGQPYVIAGVCQNKSQASICLVHQETDWRPQQSMLQKNHASRCLRGKCLISINWYCHLIFVHAQLIQFYNIKTF